MSNDPTRGPDATRGPESVAAEGAFTARGEQAATKPEQIGRYRIMRAIASGGMGHVFEGVHEITKARAAVKLIKPGFDSSEIVARFDAERQTLARFDHPNIAKVYDAGIDQRTARPYFAMEYVASALPITEFADQRRLTVRERLDLFRQTCAAIQHAHTKAIVHRDIKPGNVLAHLNDEGKPTVKVIDFGIAKALSGDRLGEMTYATQAGLAVGTYEYMSPEQAGGELDIDTRTDVYSLGVLLYELLAGVRPFDRSELARLAELELKRVIREVEPPRPSTRLSSLAQALGSEVATSRQTDSALLTRQLRRELEWIPLKAIRKERDRRYASVAQFESDVENYLAGRPLIAGPESRVYRARKFARRNRGSLAAAAAMLALIAGGTWAYIGAVREGRRVAESAQHQTELALADAQNQKSEADKQRAEAQQKQRESEAVVDFINSDVFDGATPERMPDKAVRDEIVTKMLEPAMKAVHEKFQGQPLVQAAIKQQIASSLSKLGRHAEAEPLYKDALEQRRKALGDDHADTISSLNNYANALDKLGRSAEALPLFKLALERRRRLLGVDHPDTITSLHNYANVLDLLGRPVEAEPLYKEALERARMVLGGDDLKTIQFQSNYALVLQALGNAKEAEPLFKDVLERRRHQLGDDHPSTLTSIANYASVLQSLGRAADAAPLYKDALERRRKVLGEDHPATIDALNSYAVILFTLGRADDAAPRFNEALLRRERLLGPDHPDTITALNNCAFVLQAGGHVAESEPLFKEALERRRRVLEANDPDLLVSISNYASVLNLLGRTAEAEPLLKDAMERTCRTLGADHPDAIGATNNYAGVLDALKRSAEAEPLYRDALERRRRVLGEDHPDTILSIHNLSNVLRLLGRPGEAEPLARDAVGQAEKNESLGLKHPRTRSFARNLARILADQGEVEQARTVAKKFGLPDPTTKAVTSAPTTRTPEIR